MADCYSNKCGQLRLIVKEGWIAKSYDGIVMVDCYSNKCVPLWLIVYG